MNRKEMISELIKKASDISEVPEDFISYNLRKIRENRDSAKSLNMLAPAIEPVVTDEKPLFNGKSLVDGIEGYNSVLRDGDPAVVNNLGKDDPIQQGIGFTVPRLYGEDPVDGSGTLRNPSTTGPWVSDQYKDDPFSGGGLYTREASLKLDQVINSSRHPKTHQFIMNSRSVQVALDPNPEYRKRGLFKFKCLSAGGKKYHYVFFQFLKPRGGASLDNFRPKDALLQGHDVTLSCSCEAFRFWGPLYYSVKGGYAYRETFSEGGGGELPQYDQLVEPRPRIPNNPDAESGRGQYMRICKHVVAARARLDRWLEDPKNQEMISFENFIESFDPKDEHLSSNKSEMQKWCESLGIDSYETLTSTFNDIHKDRERMGFLQKKAVEAMRGNSRELFSLIHLFSISKDSTKKILVDKLYDNPSLLLYIVGKCADQGNSLGSIKKYVVDLLQGILHLPMKKI